MHRIDSQAVSKLLRLRDPGINLLVQSLVDYANYITKLDDEFASLDLNTGNGMYMAKRLDEQRQEKHNIAISALSQLNEIAVEKLGKTVYDGSFDDRYRNEIAQAIIVLSEYFIESEKI